MLPFCKDVLFSISQCIRRHVVHIRTRAFLFLSTVSLFNFPSLHELETVLSVGQAVEFALESTQRAQVVGTCAWQRVGQPNCCRIIAVLLNLLSGARTFVPSRVRQDPKRCDRVTIPVRDKTFRLP